VIPLLRHITRSISERFRDNGLIIKYNINLSLFFYFFTIFVNWLLIIIIIIIVYYSLHTHPMGIPIISTTALLIPRWTKTSTVCVDVRADHSVRSDRLAVSSQGFLGRGGVVGVVIVEQQ